MANTILEGVKYLNEVEALMRDPLNTEIGSTLMQQLSETESYSTYIASKYRKVAFDLAKARGQYWPASGTVDERKIMLDSICADLIEANDYLKDLQEAIKQRITLGQSFIRSLRSELESGLRGTQ